MIEENKKGGIISAALLLAGYTIGTGFLLIASVTGPAGFWPGALTGLLTWLFLVGTGLLFLEVILVHPLGSSVISICRSLTGKLSATVSGFAFLVINLYFLASFYKTSQAILQEFFSTFLKITVPEFYFFLLIFGVFFLVLYLGTRVSDRVNFILFIAMIVTAIVALAVGLKKIETKPFSAKSWYLVFFAVPVIVTAYDYQSMLPSLSRYLGKNARKLFAAVLIGMAIPFIFYTIWQWFIISTSSPIQLWEAFETGKLALESLRAIKEAPLFHFFFHLMTFFSATTSVVGLGLAFFDFWADAFNISLKERIGKTRLLLCLLALGPALFIGWIFPQLFESLPSYFIGFAETFFIGVLPIWLTIKVRYIFKLPSHRFLRGGKVMLTLLSVFCFVLLYLECIQFFRHS